MLSIQLNNIKCFAHHGVFKEEQITGNYFEINAIVDYLPQNNRITNLQDTIDYGAIYTIIRERMGIPSPLLETIVMDIANSIQQQFPQVSNVTIKLTKLNPPIQGMDGTVSVSYSL